MAQECDEGTDVVLDVLIPLLVVLLMFGMGATVTFTGLKEAFLRSPKAVLTGVACQFIVMPLLALALGGAVDLSTNMAISLVVVGSCPGGTTSQLFTHFSGGDVALSIAMTAFSTTAALLMQPLILLASMAIVSPDTELKVQYGTLIVTLFVILIPVALGAWINGKNPIWGRRCATFGSIVGVVFVFTAIIYGSITMSHIWASSWRVYVCSIIIGLAGFLIGYCIARFVMKLDTKKCRTVAIETGLQNSSLGIAIVTISFTVNGCVDRDLLIFPLFYSVWIVIEGFVVSSIWGLIPTQTPPSKAILAAQVFESKDEDGTTVYRSHMAKKGLITTIPGDNATTLYENFFNAGARRHPKRPCLGTRNPKTGKYEWLNYETVADSALTFGSGLVTLGLKPGDKVALYSKNRTEWVVAEQGCNAFGLVVVPLYDTLGPDTAQYICSTMDVKVIVCGPEQSEGAAAIDGPQWVITMDGVANMLSPPLSKEPTRLTSFSTIIAKGKANKLPAVPPSPDDVATVCFTSGTTGVPKGAVLTHANLIATMSGAYLHCAEGAAGVKIKFGAHDKHISYLPLAHMFERATQCMLFRSGSAIGFFQGDVKKLVGDIQALHPTLFCVVPRLLNKIYSKIMGRITASNFKHGLFKKAYATKVARMRESNINTHGFYDATLFAKMRDALGGQVRVMITGSAPLSSTVMEWFRVCFACHVLEGYGQTETAAASHITLPGDMSMGHVGVPLPCIEIKLDPVPEMGYTLTDKNEDGVTEPRGEVCFRGPNVFKGYFTRGLRTKEEMPRYWLHSGDIGRINANGTLSIIDRRKNLFKLAQGEYVAPEKVENIYIRHPAVEQVWVHGDSLQYFLIAIVVPNMEELPGWADSVGISSTGPALENVPADEEAGVKASTNPMAETPLLRRATELCRRADVAQKLLEELTALGKEAGLHGFEQAKSLAIDDDLFAVENGLLTPTFKLRRNDLRRAYATTISYLYDPSRKPGHFAKCAPKPAYVEAAAATAGTAETKTAEPETKAAAAVDGAAGSGAGAAGAPKPDADADGAVGVEMVGVTTE